MVEPGDAQQTEALKAATIEELREAVAHADVPPLLAAVAVLTGNRDVLDEACRPPAEMLMAPDAGMTPDQVERGRQLAVDALASWKETDGDSALDLDTELSGLLGFLTGRDDDLAEYLPLFCEELGIGGQDLRAPEWRAEDLAPDREFRIVVIGAGMSGLLAAHRFRQAGLHVTVLEKNDDVGGTWLENTYPGCRVDVPNHFYSYSFRQKDDWPQHFSTQEVLLDYFRRCADDWGLRDLIRFGTEVLTAEFDDDSGRWALEVRTDDDVVEVIGAHAVVSAVGQLNRPLLPDIEGRDDYEGPAFHTARWDHDVDLAGKRVAVIGTGASAMQAAPAIVDEVDELLVFQRTPAWLIPTPEYMDDLPDGARWLFAHLPGYAAWYRFWLFWRNAEGMLPVVSVEEGWEDDDEAVGMLNEMLRQLLLGHLQTEFGDDPELLEAVTPHYPPGSKRVIRDNGIWSRTLKRDDVTLITTGIERITESGVRTVDGVDHDVDVIVYGTGFQASKFLTPMTVRGRSGRDLHETWAGDARAHLGVTLPGFPNFFLLYGPNTNIVINGSIIYFTECEVGYVLSCLEHLLREDRRWLDCRPEAHDAFNAEVDAGNLQRAWGVATVNSWYRNEHGRSAQNWPFTLLDYWERTRQVDPAEYEVG